MDRLIRYGERTRELGGSRTIGIVAKQMSHQPDNIFAGTQVVSLVEVRGPHHSLVLPRGAVGFVTRTPALEGENNLVRFPDGFEKTLEPSQLEVLKHFKDRLGDPALTGACLKRALEHLQKSQAGLEPVAPKKLLPEKIIAEARQELFEIRENILKLMDEFRRHG
jgi:hypothetical protein